MENKRGDTNVIAVLIAAVLGIVLIAVLVVALTGTWKTFAFWIPKDNIQTVVTQCNADCSMNSQYAFCTAAKTLVAQDLPGKVSEVTGSCQNFSDSKAVSKGQTIILTSSYGISGCSSLC